MKTQSQKSQKSSSILKNLKIKYRSFRKKIPKTSRRIGVEFEFQIVTRNGSKPNFQILKTLIDFLSPKLNFSKQVFDEEGHCIKCENSLGDLISFEYGSAILELSLAPATDLHSIHKKSSFLTKTIQRYLKKFNLSLLPLGINPFSWKKDLCAAKTSYYQMLEHFFTRFFLGRKHSYTNTCAFICSAQTHIDVTEKELPICMNLLNSLGWVKALLFSNSPFEGCLCGRDLLWQDLALARHRENIGIRNKWFSKYDDVLLDTLNNSIFYVKRNGFFIYFQPLSVKQFLKKKVISGWQLKNDQEFKTTFKPLLEDISFSRPYNDAVITTKGTIEARSECIQPINELMTPAAFHLGLQFNMKKITKHVLEIRKIINKNTFSQLRKEAIFKGYKLQKDLPFDIKKFVLKLLLLIQEGLEKRKMGEECYLNPLFLRLENQSNPAAEWIKERKKGFSLVQLARELIDEKR